MREILDLRHRHGLIESQSIANRLIIDRKSVYQLLTNALLTRAVRDRIRTPRRMVCIRNPYLDMDSGSGLIPKLHADFLVQGYTCDKIFMKIRSLSTDKPNCEKNALSLNVEESFKKFLDRDPEADDFQNLTSSSLCTDTSVVKVL